MTFTIYIGKIPFECIQKENFLQDEVIEKITEARNKQNLWFYLFTIISSVDVFDSDDNRNSMIKMFKYPKMYEHAINLFIAYSQIDFLKINIQYYKDLIDNKDASEETIKWCRYFIILIEDNKPQVHDANKTEIDLNEFKRICGEHFEMDNEKYGTFKLLGFSNGYKFNEHFYKKFGFSSPNEFNVYRHKIFAIFKHHGNNNYLYCQFVTK